MGHLPHKTCTREQQGWGNSARGRGTLTVHNDLDDPQINLAAGHEATLACVCALICLLYATDLKVIVVQHLEANWRQEWGKWTGRSVTYLANQPKSITSCIWSSTAAVVSSGGVQRDKTLNKLLSDFDIFGWKHIILTLMSVTHSVLPFYHYKLNVEFLRDTVLRSDPLYICDLFWEFILNHQ